MNIIKEKKYENGKRSLTIVLDKGETVIALKDGLYRLGYPLFDVVPVEVLSESTPVYWDCVSQVWEDKT
jgi:hypothetical protein